MHSLYDSCMSDLRERQREMARTSIVEACAELVTERHQLDFSMAEVAEGAGVSLRTVYNHFADREALLDALGQAFNRSMEDAGGATADGISGLDDLTEAIRTNAQLFEKGGGISAAFAQMPLADVGVDQERTTRTRRIADLIATEMPSVSEREAEVIALTCRHLFSHRSWFWLTHEYGMSTDEFVAVTTWAVRALIDTADSGDRPLEEDR